MPCRDDRGPHNRQAQGDIDGAPDRHQLIGNQTLIVVTGDDRVEVAAHRAHNTGTGDRSRDFNASGAARRTAAQDVFLFPPPAGSRHGDSPSARAAANA